MPDGLTVEENEMKETIKFYQKQGYSKKQIAKLLKNKGYNPDLVDEQLSTQKREFKGIALTEKKKMNWKRLIIKAAEIVIILALILLAWNVLSGTQSVKPQADIIRTIQNMIS